MNFGIETHIGRRRIAGLMLAASLLAACAGSTPVAGVLWTPTDFVFEAARDHRWSEFPAKAVWTHEATGERLETEAFWLRDRSWAFRFAAPRPGRWTFETESEDRGLDGRTGTLDIPELSVERIAANPNLRGPIRPSANGRFFESANGAPFLMLADTLWAGNTLRAGLGENGSGPFFRYVADRKEKGFTTVLIGVVHGFGDYQNNPTGHANEGGHLFVEQDFEHLNADYLELTDRRWRALHEEGLAIASPLMWWGKTSHCVFTPEQARDLAAYFAVRYGAFNVIWALSGEFEYTFQDCGWTKNDLDALGEAVQAHNPYRRPVSIHPSGRTTWERPYGVQSSRPFQDSSWMDHYWLQTGQSVDRMFWIVERAEENRALEPARPVFCSEAYYERVDDADGAYHSRWQAWTALLSGCAGYGYGAQGVWQFRDEAFAEPGKLVEHTAEWRQAIALEGSRQAGLAAKILGRLPWERLTPVRQALLVDGAPAAKPTPEDLSPPTHAEISGELHIVYLPRGNGGRTIEVREAAEAEFESWWVNPRTGESIGIGDGRAVEGKFTLPQRPEPDEDWVVVIEKRLPAPDGTPTPML